MSYADAQLDLSEIQVVCLQGPNGAGKSALLDAVTWALWECARSSSDDLIRLGEREMWVDLSFSYESQLFRIRRSRHKSPSKSGGKGISKGTLEFQICCPNEPDGNGHSKGAWKSLTGSNMRETQHQICSLLRMDYDTFINSAYIRQGKADEFTTRIPSERKQVLSEILGLSYFGQLQERSREKARTLRSQIEVLEAIVAQLPDKKQQLDQAKSKLAELRIDFEAKASRAKEAETGLAALSDRLKKLMLMKQSFQLGEAKSTDLTADIGNLTQQEEETTARLNVLVALIEHSCEIEAAAKQFETLKNQVEILDREALEQQELSEKRLELRSELANRRSRLEVELEHCHLNLKTLQAKHAKIAEHTADRDKVYASYEQYKGLSAREAEWAKKQEAYAQLRERVAQLESTIAEARIRLEAELSQKQSSLNELDSILTNACTIESQKAELQEQAEMLEKCEAEFELVEQKGIIVKCDLETRERNIQDLKDRQTEHLQKIQELKEHTDSTVCPLCSAPIVDRAAVIDRYYQLNKNIDNELIQLQELVERLQDERSDLRKQYLELRQKLNERKTLDKQIGEFNERLSALRRASENKNKLSKECNQLKAMLERQEYAEIERESLIGVKAEIHKLEFDPFVYSNLQGQLRRERHIESRFREVNKELAELRQLEKDLPEWQSKIARLSDELSSESYGSEIRLELTITQQRLAKLSYDRNVHLKLKNELNGFLWSMDKTQELKRAVSERPPLEELLSNVKHMLNSKKEQLHLLEDDLSLWKTEVNYLPELAAEAEVLESDLLSLRQTKEEAAKCLAVLEAQEQQLIADVEELNGHQTELGNKQVELDDYLFLVEAFGKKGIQAIIIENAVPEIESEANRILSRLTDNKMHVAFLTQYQNKTGNIVETLELVIGDDVGSRNYELYSGGEAFKVNFAIRVALARLLARRSGAKLETLIIDEGFGSQDEASRDRLVKAIGSIQGDFARILVITHMADIKEMFPVQIQVTKRNGASELELLS